MKQKQKDIGRSSKISVINLIQGEQLTQFGKRLDLRTQRSIEANKISSLNTDCSILGKSNAIRHPFQEVLQENDACRKVSNIKQLNYGFSTNINTCESYPSLAEERTYLVQQLQGENTQPEYQNLSTISNQDELSCDIKDNELEYEEGDLANQVADSLSLNPKFSTDSSQLTGMKEYSKTNHSNLETTQDNIVPQKENINIKIPTVNQENSKLAVNNGVAKRVKGMNCVPSNIGKQKKENLYLIKESNKTNQQIQTLCLTNEIPPQKKKQDTQSEDISSDLEYVEGVYITKKIDVRLLLNYGKCLDSFCRSFGENDQHIWKDDNTINTILQEGCAFLNATRLGSQDLEEMCVLFRDQKARKIVRRSIALQMMCLVIVSQNLLRKEIFKFNLTVLRNILLRSCQSYQCLLAVIQYKVHIFDQQDAGLGKTNQEQYPLIIKSTESSQLEKTFGDNKAAQISLLNQIRITNELSLKDVMALTKNDKDFQCVLLKNFKELDQHTTLSQYFTQQLEFYSLYITLWRHHQSQQLSIFVIVPFMSTAPAPYLPVASSQYGYTLVLDLDETLIHYADNLRSERDNSSLLIRPYLQTFLENISQHYELIVFTAGLPDYANWVIDSFDTQQYLQVRLFRHHTIQSGNTFIKDLSRIGRNLAKTIIIDNLAENFQLQPDNGIFIRDWTGDPSDAALIELLPLLQEIALSKAQDVRVALRLMKEQIQDNIMKGIEHPHLNLKL